MKILVTGGAGFIGSQIADRFIELGYNVTILDDLSTGRRENINPKAQFVEADIRSEQAAELLRDGGFDVVSHQAAQVDVRASTEDPVKDAELNILGSVNLMQAAHKGGVKQFIFASSGGAGYGEQDTFPADETHKIQPLSPYGITKVTVERYLYFYHHEYDFNATCVRYANVYGPRQNPHGEAGVVAIFINRLLNDQEAFINGDGLQTRDFVFVKDVVQANEKVLGETGFNIYNVGTGVETNVVQVFDTINAGLDAGRERNHREAAAGEQRRSVLDAGKIAREKGWQVNYDFQKGMAETIEWFKARHQQAG